MLDLIAEPQDALDFSVDHDVVFVDLCSAEQYAAAHIEGAIHVSPAEIVSGVKPATGKIAPIDRLNALFGRLGKTDNTHFIAYDDEGGGWAGRFVWTCFAVGHRSASAIDGGLHAWHAAGLPLTADVPTPASSTVDLTLDTSVIAEKADVLASLDDVDTVVWDARSAEEHAGTKVVAARGGRVPGAINLDWLLTMDRERALRTRLDVQEVLNGLGITPDKRVITHCQTHHRSGLTWLIGQSLGYDIKAYHGSWSEWGNDPDTPIES